MNRATLSETHAAVMQRLMHSSREFRAMKFRIGRLTEYELDEELKTRGCGLRGSVVISNDEIERRVLGGIPPKKGKKRRANSDNQ
ncbi:hypothetical protein TSAR_009783, partial [Trichomalopsis sarcophagae]